MPKTVPRVAGAPPPVGPYSVATEANGFVFISGQVAFDPAGGATPDDLQGQTKLVLENIGAILGSLGLHYTDVVKTTVFLADIRDFSAFNQVYAGYFENEPPARTTVQAGALPGAGLKVEIDVVAAR
jgi:2-iminobutanoate/2-iminopropanoate deaminase